MAKYTTTLRSICETSAGLEESRGQLSISQIIASARSSIFSFDYPIYDERYRSVLETKIIRHYYMREIGMETVGLWKMYLEARMNEIMPYYNKLYESELLELEPFADIDYTRSGNSTGQKTGSEEGSVTATRSDANTGTITDEGSDSKTRNGTITTQDSTSATATEERTDTGAGSKSTESTETNTGTIRDVGTKTNTRTDDLQEDENYTINEGKKNDHWDYYSDTPQGSVQDLASLSYLTNARHVTDDGTGSTTSRYLTKTNVGTVEDSGSDENLRTLNTAVGGSVTEETDSSLSSETTRTDSSTTNGSLTSRETDQGEKENTRTLNTILTSDTTTDTTNSSTATTTGQYLERIVGRTGKRTNMELLEQLRASYLNIDMLIIRDLADLFFGLWE